MFSSSMFSSICQQNSTTKIVGIPSWQSNKVLHMNSYLAICSFLIIYVCSCLLSENNGLSKQNYLYLEGVRVHGEKQTKVLIH